MRQQHSKALSLSAGIVFFLSTLCSCGQPTAPSPQVSENAITGDEILKHLNTKQDEELHQYLIILRNISRNYRFADAEVDPIITQLLVIQDSDPYQKQVDVKDSENRKLTLYVNRRASNECIFRFRFQKISNSLDRLPLEQRVAKIIDGIENPIRGMGYSTDQSFIRELVRVGEDAVPFIVQYNPEHSSHRRAIIRALVAIGDPRGIEYIIEVLNTPGDSFRFARPDAAKALGTFDDTKKVVPALVKALKDETYWDVDRKLPQSPSPDHIPYNGRHYTVQHAAATSLTKLTGNDWGLFYNEDYRTWATWLLSGSPDSFSPESMDRNDAEVEKLIEYLFHRYMSARPNPWQSENTLETPEGISNLSADLKSPGLRVVPLLVKEYYARVEEDPVWHNELQEWTRSLLQSLEWDEANKAAATELE